MKKLTAIPLVLSLAGFVIGCSGSADNGTGESADMESLESDSDYEKEMLQQSGGAAEKGN